MMLKIRVIFLLLIIALATQFSLIDAATVTTYIDRPASLLNYANKMYEISQASLDQGNNVSLEKMDAILLNIGSQNYYFVVANISGNSLNLVTLSGNHFILNLNQTRVIDFSDASSGNTGYVGFTLVSSNEDKAELFVKTYQEKINTAMGSSQLFDISVKLNKDKIISMMELVAYITFTNFGNGPSNVKITYSISDMLGKEFYHGIDEKVVYTQDVVTKSFDFLNLPQGNYVFSAKIDYGDNQTASSAINFSIISATNFYTIINLIIFFTIIIVIFVILQILRRKYYQKEKELSKNKNKTKN